MNFVLFFVKKKKIINLILNEKECIFVVVVVIFIAVEVESVWIWDLQEHYLWCVCQSSCITRTFEEA